jgi:hypothetical protein
MPVGKVKQISRNMDRWCRSSWTGVHDFFQPEEYDAGASATKHEWRTTGYTPACILKTFLNFKRRTLM